MCFARTRIFCIENQPSFVSGFQSCCQCGHLSPTKNEALGVMPQMMMPGLTTGGLTGLTGVAGVGTDPMAAGGSDKGNGLEFGVWNLD